VEHFARQVSAQNGWKPIPFTDSAIEAFKRYTWPGNVRELRNVVERLLLLADTVIDAEAVQLALPAAHSNTAPTHPSASSRSTTPSSVSVEDTEGALSERVSSFERAEVLKELERHSGHVTQTAKALGLERSHLYKKCQQLGIDLKTLEDRK
jgi:two-component system nitrogen regulation response regulator NtrX